LVFAAGPSLAQAQAWTPEATTLSVEGGYQLGYATRTEHVDGTVIHHVIIPAVEYGITDSFAVSATLPFMLVRAVDPGMFAHGAWDDDKYHSTLTDLRFTARYMIPLGFVAVTPHLGASTPVADYVVQGRAAAGRHLKAAYVGLSVGADLDEYVPRSSLHLSYEFALVEKFKGAGAEGEAIDQNISTLAAQIGHTIGRFGIHAAVEYYAHHDGVAFSEFPALTPLQVMNHDPILRERVLLIGGGVGYQLNDSTSISATTRIFISGENTHNASLFAIGASWDIDL
jgi:hypothetical protein